MKATIQAIEGNAIIVPGEYDHRGERRLRKPQNWDKVQETVVACRYLVTVEIVIGVGKPTPKWLSGEEVCSRVVDISYKN